MLLLLLLAAVAAELFALGVAIVSASPAVAAGERQLRAALRGRERGLGARPGLGLVGKFAVKGGPGRTKTKQQLG